MNRHPKTREEIEAHFWNTVEKTPTCWIWAGDLNSKGYGWISVYAQRKRLLAHRFSWELHHGPIAPGLCVLHRCDTPKCVNPEHLSLGSKKENSQDMANKGRQYLQRATREVQLSSAAHMRAIGGQQTKTHCLRGHPFSGTNLWIGKAGRRICRECKLTLKRQYRREGRIR